MIKTGAKVVSHGRYVAFQMAEISIPETCSPESCSPGQSELPDRFLYRHAPDASRSAPSPGRAPNGGEFSGDKDCVCR
jgi:hypothetical protein